MPRGIKYSAETMDQVLQACKTSSQSEVARKFGISDHLSQHSPVVI